MKKIALGYGYDEFNYCDITNNFLSNNRIEGEEYYTYAGYNFLILFESFDKILIDGNNPKNCLHIRNWYTENDIEFRGNYTDDKRHVYPRNFTDINKVIQTRGFNTIKPLEHDYVEIKNRLNNINKPIVAISGRNLPSPRAHNRNNLLVDYIKRLIDCGAYVINTTVEKPNLEFDENYEEIDKTTYSETVSYFLLSNSVICLGHSGGVSTHLKCSGNFFIVNNHETWINHPSVCEYKGETILSYRLKQSYPKTYSKEPNTKISNEEIDWLLNQNKPEIINEFFDTSKVIFLGKN